MVNARRLRTTEAAARLGVKPATLYAYVSRGLLSRERSSSGSTFDVIEVERLAQTARKAGGVTRGQRQMAFVTELTLIDDGHLYYRGRDAVDLAASAPFEAVAEWLWSGDWCGTDLQWEPPDAPALRSALAAVSALPPRATALARLSAATVATGSGDPMRHDRSPRGVAAVGRRLIGCMVAALGAAPAPPRPGRSVARSLAGALAGDIAGAPTSTVPDAWATAIGGALVLMADHEMAASTLAVRVAASVGADPYAAVVSGLGAIGGTRHGGASVEVHRLLADAQREGGLAAVGARLAGYGGLPGFGMELYPEGDPRGAALIHLVRNLPAPEERLASVESVLEAVSGRDIPPPNCDFGLAALGYVLGLGPEAGEAVFVIARTAGWLAHAAEEYTSRTSFRVRAAYTGIRPR